MIDLFRAIPRTKSMVLNRKGRRFSLDSTNISNNLSLLRNKFQQQNRFPLLRKQHLNEFITKYNENTSTNTPPFSVFRKNVTLPKDIDKDNKTSNNNISETESFVNSPSHRSVKSFVSQFKQNEPKQNVSSLVTCRRQSVPINKTPEKSELVNAFSKLAIENQNRKLTITTVDKPIEIKPKKALSDWEKNFAIKSNENISNSNNSLSNEMKSELKTTKNIAMRYLSKLEECQENKVKSICAKNIIIPKKTVENEESDRKYEDKTVNSSENSTKIVETHRKYSIKQTFHSEIYQKPLTKSTSVSVSIYDLTKKKSLIDETKGNNNNNLNLHPLKKDIKNLRDHDYTQSSIDLINDNKKNDTNSDSFLSLGNDDLSDVTQFSTKSLPHRRCLSLSHNVDDDNEISIYSVDSFLTDMTTNETSGSQCSSLSQLSSIVADKNKNEPTKSEDKTNSIHGSQESICTESELSNFSSLPCFILNSSNSKLLSSDEIGVKNDDNDKILINKVKKVSFEDTKDVDIDFNADTDQDQDQDQYNDDNNDIDIGYYYFFIVLFKF
jgi:hypothetical protein